jgi:hypothetical protein
MVENRNHAGRRVNGFEVQSHKAQRHEVNEHADFQIAADFPDSIQTRTCLWRYFIRIHGARIDEAIPLVKSFLSNNDKKYLLNEIYAFQPLTVGASVLDCGGWRGTGLTTLLQPPV